MLGCEKKAEYVNKGLNQHYDGEKFKNHEVEYKSDFLDFVSNIWTFITDKTKNKIALKDEIPIVKLSKEDILNMPDNSVLRIVHSTLLLKMDGKLILTDPVFSKKISPFPFFGPIRFHDLPITIAELPFIDYVIISHNHYDHLDESSLKQLKDKVGHFYTTLGVKQKLLDIGIDTMKVCELDWWQSCINETLRITATPAQHFSGRGVFDRDETLWASWTIKSSKANVYFSGDTGYFNTFKKISEKYGPFDMAFLEAGAYNESWKQIHMLPEQTVQANIDLNAKILFPIHNSSFNLSIHPWDEPLNRVSKIAKEKNVRAIYPKFGQIVSLLKYTEISKWWLKK